MKKLKQFFRHHRPSRGWRIVRHPATILAMEVVKLGVVEYLADKRAIKDRFIRFGQIRNESDGRMVVIPASTVSMYKAQGARATDPGKDQGEANAPFVDNKLSLFFSAVNGVMPIVRMWWNLIDRLCDAFLF